MPFRVSGVATSIACTVTSGEVAIPNDENGTRARYVLVQNADATNIVHFRVGLTGQTAITSDTVAPQFGYPILMHVAHATHIAARTAAGTATFIITPVETAR